MCAGFFAGIFQLLVVKHGSAALMVVGMAISVPLSDIAFAIPAFMGAAARHLNGYNIGGVFLVVLGFVFYNSNQLPKSWTSWLTCDRETEAKTPLLGKTAGTSVE